MEQQIAQHPFFKGISPVYLPLLAKGATVQKVDLGDLICQEGEDADHFYLVMQGQFASETFVPGRGVVTIQTIGPHDAFGWSALFAPYHWHFTVRATQPGEMIVLDAKALRATAEEVHDFGYELVSRVAHLLLQRFLATRMQLLEFYDAADLVPA